MGKVVWHVTMSVDGFIAGPNDSIDWVFNYIEPAVASSNPDLKRTQPAVEQGTHSTGAVLSGRRSYDAGKNPAQDKEVRRAKGGGWSGPQFVLTHRAPANSKESSVSFVSGDIRRVVADALSAAAGKNLMVIG